MDMTHHYMMQLYFESAGMILTLISLGKYLESRSKQKTSEAIEKLMKLMPSTAIVLKEGKDVTIFATGLCVNETVEAEKMLAKDGIDAEIINIHTIKPIDRELVVKSALKTGKVVTVEEHSVIGGLGSAVCDVLCEEAPTKVLKIGVNDVFGESGPALELLHKYELDAEGIYKKVKAFVK